MNTLTNGALLTRAGRTLLWGLNNACLFVSFGLDSSANGSKGIK